MTDIHFDHVFVSGYPDHGIVTSDSWGHKYSDFLIEYCGGDGIRYVNDGGVQQTMIENAFIAHNGGWGVNFVSGAGGSMSDHKWDLQAANNDLGGVRLGESTRNCRFYLTVLNNGESHDGVDLAGGVTANTFDIQANNQGNYGLNLSGGSSVTKNLIRINGRNNSAGLFPRETGGRNVINGYGYSDGAPSGYYTWSSFVDWAFESGVLIWDVSTSPWTPYRADGAGNWIEMATV